MMVVFLVMKKRLMDALFQFVQIFSAFRRVMIGRQ